MFSFFFSSRRRHTRCALVTGVQTCALPISLWVDRLSSGRAPMGVELSEADGERIIRLVAAHVGAEVHRGQPLLSAALPETGERFEGILPPDSPGPAFAFRKRATGEIGSASCRDRGCQYG